MSPDDLKGLSILPLDNFVSDYIDHNGLRKYRLKISPGQLENNPTFGAGYDSSPSLNVPDIEELFLCHFLNLLGY